MKAWKKGDAIVFTYPEGNTYRFTLDLISSGGFLQFLSDPERGAMGGTIQGGLTLSCEQAQAVWEANEAACRAIKDRCFDENFHGCLAYLLSKGQNKV